MCNRTEYIRDKLFVAVLRSIVRSRISVIVNYGSMVSYSGLYYIPLNCSRKVTRSSWRNRLARLTVNQEVGSSSLPGDVVSFLVFSSFFQSSCCNYLGFCVYKFLIESNK